MLHVINTIVIQRGTFGTQLEFSLYNGDTSKDLPASSYDKIVLRAISFANGKESFHGDVVEDPLSAVTTNIVNYALIEKNTLQTGTYKLNLELLTLNEDSTVVTAKEVISAGKLKIE
jgi:hypothetical protein